MPAITCTLDNSGNFQFSLPSGSFASLSLIPKVQNASTDAIKFNTGSFDTSIPIYENMILSFDFSDEATAIYAFAITGTIGDSYVAVF